MPKLSMFTDRGEPDPQLKDNEDDEEIKTCITFSEPETVAGYTVDKVFKQAHGTKYKIKFEYSK